MHITDNPTNAIFNLQGVMSDKAINEFKFGYNAAPTNIIGSAPVINGIDFSSLAINLSGSVANTGIAGQGASSGIVVPGGLVRANSATNGHAQPYDPYSLSFADSFSYVTGNHYAEARRRVPRDPHGDGPDRRHHLLLREPDRVPGQPGERASSTWAT